jgi:hypothetical protein
VKHLQRLPLDENSSKLLHSVYTSPRSLQNPNKRIRIECTTSHTTPRSRESFAALQAYLNGCLLLSLLLVIYPHFSLPFLKHSNPPLHSAPSPHLQNLLAPMRTDPPCPPHPPTLLPSTLLSLVLPSQSFHPRIPVDSKPQVLKVQVTNPAPSTLSPRTQIKLSTE